MHWTMRAIAVAVLLPALSCAPTEESEGMGRGGSSESIGGAADSNAGRVAPGTLLSSREFQNLVRQSSTPWIVVQLFQETCAPCLTESLRLNERLEDWKARGITVIGCGADPTPAETRGFAENTGGRIEFPLYHAPWLAEEVGLEATPTLLLYSREGKLVAKFDPDRTEGDLLEAVEAAARPVTR